MEPPPDSITGASGPFTFHTGWVEAVMYAGPHAPRTTALASKIVFTTERVDPARDTDR
jgi:hypothetical protein